MTLVSRQENLSISMALRALFTTCAKWVAVLVIAAGGFQLSRAQDSIQATVVSGEQTIRSGDSISVGVLEEGAISGSFKVGKDGGINYPLLGRVLVAGNTLDETAKQIEAALEQDYLRDALVSVTMAARQENSVFIFGAVRGQGAVAFDPAEGMTLGRAIALMGGTDETADTSKVEIQRSDTERPSESRVNLNSQQELVLEDGDIVVVGRKPEIVAQAVRDSFSQKEAVEMGRVIVSGQVNREGIVEVPLEGGLSMLEVMAMAGGSTRLARLSRVKVNRKMPDGSDESYTVDVDKIRKIGGEESFTVLAGDRIYVPESIF